MHNIQVMHDELNIPLCLHGCISYFLSQLPMQEELSQCCYVYMMSEKEWEPYSSHFMEQEAPFMTNKYIAAMSSTDWCSETDASTLAK